MSLEENFLRYIQLSEKQSLNLEKSFIRHCLGNFYSQLSDTKKRGVKMETRSYLINQELLPFYKKVCKRDEIDYHIICKDGTFFLNAAISNRQFRILREDAVCEKECEASQTKIPVYSYRTLKNPNKFKRLRKVNGRTTFRIMEKDLERYKKDFNIA